MHNGQQKSCILSLSILNAIEHMRIYVIQVYIPFDARQDVHDLIPS
jgi:hypothetical protein